MVRSGSFIRAKLQEFVKYFLYCKTDVITTYISEIRRRRKVRRGFSSENRCKVAVPGIAPSGQSDNRLDHFCPHKASSPSSVNWYIDLMIPL